MRSVLRGRAGVLLFILGLVVASAATAGAASLITGKQIKDGSISRRDLSRSVRAQMNKAAAPGPRGPQGPAGPAGAAGAPGSPGSPAASILTARSHVGVGQEAYIAASGPSTASASESDVAILTPDVTTVAGSLVIRERQTSADDNTRVYELRVNGADTALTCSLVHADKTCSDPVHRVTIPPESEVSIHRALITGTGGGADGTDIIGAWRATTP